MLVYFVSRHEGAIRWARIMQKLGGLPYPVDQYVEHLELSQVKKGDVVIGTLPLKACAELTEKGARYVSLDLSVPPQWRGQELSATQMAKCDAKLTQYRVTVKETYDLRPSPTAKAAPTPSEPVTLMLVSHELMPQYLGYVHAHTPLVVLAVTDSMKERGKALERLLNAAPMPPQRIVTIPLEDAQGYPELLEQADQVMDAFVSKNPECAHINLTGGTKLMSMAFGEAGRSAQREGHPVRLHYVDTAHGRIERIERTNAKAEPMRPVLGVHAAVLASGKELAGCASTSERFQTFMQRRDLHAKLLSLPNYVLGALNELGADMTNLHRKKSNSHSGIKWVLPAQSDAQALRFSIPVQPKSPSHRKLAQALQGKLGAALFSSGVLREHPSSDEQKLTLMLSSPDEIDYLMGGWLEAHLASLIEAAKPDDWACGVEIGIGAGKSNEIDALVTCGNRTLLIEVKTANLGRFTEDSSGEKSTKAQDALYKLDSIGHELARNFNENWLVSARPLSDADVERAKDKRIVLFAPTTTRTADGQVKTEPTTVAVRKFERALTDWVKASRARVGGRKAEPFEPLPVSETWERRAKRAAGEATPPPAQTEALQALANRYSRAPHARQQPAATQQNQAKPSSNQGRPQGQR
ncbi:putative CRISPR-associated protein (TIGR02620 family) [Tibeticola sediminis]|uniref:Putative CRISPR-associated protein (TIGR02620 family) n=1 Tax=Tibeticola sediminis TaxID=1917811 RepID=A0A3N4UQT6_9BURK|nr:CRISPR-associated protein Csx16 [Tibeticola sediminis]RPE63044.1 putative CRISPR-associated protein (TIGR02620 family) [Tibeticola sediminis]